MISRSTKKNHLITLKEKHCKSYHKYERNINDGDNDDDKRNNMSKIAVNRKNSRHIFRAACFFFYLNRYKLTIRAPFKCEFLWLLDDPYRCLHLYRSLALCSPFLSHHFVRVNTYVAMKKITMKIKINQFPLFVYFGFVLAAFLYVRSKGFPNCCYQCYTIQTTLCAEVNIP